MLIKGRKYTSKNNGGDKIDKDRLGVIVLLEKGVKEIEQSQVV